MYQLDQIKPTIKQIQSIITIETKSIRKKGTAGEGKLVAISKLCNSLRKLIELTTPIELDDNDDVGNGDPDFRDRWQREIEERRLKA